MTRYLYATDFAVPAGTAIATPLVAPVTLEDLHLDTVRIIIPDGHNGLTGIMITSGGVNIAPYVQGTWLVGNNEIIDFGYDGEIQQSRLSLAGYNTDIFPHTFHLRWTLSELVTGSPVVIDSPQGATALPATTVATVANLTGVVDQAALDQMAADAAAAGPVLTLTGAP